MKNDNKGFSLIELIVVIAIMAILVGAMAPQVTKYIEKARISNDKQSIGALYTAVQTVYVDPDIENPSTWPADFLTSTTSETFKDNVKTTLGGASGTAIYTTTNTGIIKLNSKAYKGSAVTVTVDSNGAVTITVPTATGYTGDEKTTTKDGFKVTASGTSDNPIS